VPIWVTRWEKWVKLSPIEKSFESVNSRLRYLDQPVPVILRPSSERKTDAYPAWEGRSNQNLLDEHQTSLYTSRIADVTQARRAALNLRMQ